MGHEDRQSTTSLVPCTTFALRTNKFLSTLPVEGYIIYDER